MVTLYGRNWLSGSIIDGFIGHFIDSQLGPIDKIHFLGCYFYGCLIGIGNSLSAGEYNNPCHYNFRDVASYTRYWDVADFQKDILIIVHQFNHWIIIIISAKSKEILVYDGFGIDRGVVVRNLKRWYRDAIFSQCNQTLADNYFDDWTIHLTGAKGSKLLDAPKQTDGSSCGVMSAFFALDYIRERKISRNSDWNQDVVAHLRSYMAFHLIIARRDIPGYNPASNKKKKTPELRAFEEGISKNNAEVIEIYDSDDE
jgi:Ulp1 family protease